MKIPFDRLRNPLSEQDSRLAMWVVYERPKDYPDHYVARRYLCAGIIGGTATEDVLISDSLYALRLALYARGLVCLQRHPDDDAVILEVWM